MIHTEAVTEAVAAVTVAAVREAATAVVTAVVARAAARAVMESTVVVRWCASHEAIARAAAGEKVSNGLESASRHRIGMPRRGYGGRPADGCGRAVLCCKSSDFRFYRESIISRMQMYFWLRSCLSL